MKKTVKFFAAVLTAVMAVSAISISAMAADEETTYTEENGIIYTCPSEALENSQYAIFVMEDDTIKQITPLEDKSYAIEDLSVSIENEEIVVTNEDDEIVQISPLAFKPADDINTEGFVYKEYVVTGNNVNMWNYDRTEVILTLEKGVHFWSRTISSPTGYLYGYVRSNGNQIFGMVSKSYLAAV